MSNARSSRSPRRHVPNTRDNPSAALSLAQVIGLGDAAEHAIRIGCPLNEFITIHFEAAKLRPDYRAQDAISRYLRLAGQWLRTLGVPITYIWILEHATGTGEHVHIMMHCPPWHRAAFRDKAEEGWMIKAGMLPRSKRKTGIKIVKIGPRSYHPTTHTGHATYEAQFFGLLPYHLKAIDRDCMPANDNRCLVPTLTSGRTLPIEPEHSNAIYGRRCSRSENIGSKARLQYQAQLLDEAF